MEYGMLIEDLRNVQAWLGHGDVKKAHEYLESIIVSLEAAEQSVHPTGGNCAECGEEIINEREVMREGQPYCAACAGPAYYAPEALLFVVGGVMIEREDGG